jgi:ligand-binding sensor domain-containing protein/signal transduction histidine kinase
MCKTMNPAQMHGLRATRSLSQRLIGKLATLLSRRNLLRLTGWLPFLIFSYAVPAEKTAAPHLEYTRTVWRVSDGLPEDTVQALTESSEGFLWIGTTGGLARFDGTHIQIYGQGMAQPLSVNSIFCVALGKDGSLWAGTEGGGLLRLRGNRLRVYSSNDGLTEGFVRSVYEDDRGRLWVGTDDGLFVLEGERLRRVDQGTAFASMGVHSITEDHKHRIWAGGSRLIAIDRDGHERDFPLPGAYSENTVKRILETRDGTLWVGTVGGLQRLEHGRFRTVPGIHATVRSLLQTSDGTLWIGTIGDGLWTFRDGRLTRVSRPGFLPSDTVLSIFEDDQGQIWIGTQAGLVRLNKTMVSLVPLPEGGDPDFETISGDDVGDVWVAAHSLYLIRDGQARRVTYPGLGPVTIRNVYRARDGALWIGTDGGGVYSMRQGKIRHYTAPAELTNNFIRGFLESHDGYMWIATDGGVSRIGRDGVGKFTVANGLAYSSTRSLLEDRGGNIWIGTDRGLNCWADGSFRQNNATRALAEEKVWSILQDHNGTLWFGTRDHGLFRYRDGSVQQFTVAQGLPSNSLYQILQDRRGTFWLTSPNLIASVQEAEIDGPYPSADRPMSAEVYSMPFGGDGAQIYGGRQPSGYLAPDDSVWFPSTRGAVHIETVKQPPAPAPRAVLEEVVEDGRSAAPDAGLQVPAHVARLSFAFGAISLRAQEGVRFRYKLENFDSGWNISASNRTATYTNLPAGHYRFRVVVFDASEPAVVSEADLSFTKAPFFYETWWFYTLGGLLIVLMAWSIYHVRLRQIKTRFSAVLEERNRLAREMHDTVIQGCTGTSALLEAIASTAAEDRTADWELLEYARVQIRSTINEAREAVWNMRQEREKEIDLIKALGGVVTQMSREYGNAVAFEHNLDRLDIGASGAHEILMTVREALYNSIQHSGTDRLALGVHVFNDGNLTISVTDHGCGFCPDRTSVDKEGHYGIVGMRERMQRLGGRFELTSQIGAGTTVRLVVHRSKGRMREQGS